MVDMHMGDHQRQHVVHREADLEVIGDGYAFSHRAGSGHLLGWRRRTPDAPSAYPAYTATRPAATSAHRRHGKGQRTGRVAIPISLAD
jgi:hypothetical protein